MASLAVSNENVSQEEGQPADKEGPWVAKKEDAGEGLVRHFPHV